MKYKNSFLIICFLVLMLSFVFGSSNKVYGKSDEIFNDYSKDSSTFTTTISVNDFFEKILNEKLSEAEKKYLSDKGIIIAFEDRISTNFVTTSINDNEMKVYASEYSYIDKNNREVIWYPCEVELNGVKKQFIKNNDSYECFFDNLKATDDTINIFYSSNFIVKKETINKIINNAYDEANYYVSNKIIESKNKEYLINKQAYDKYLKDLEEYNTNVINYNEYLTLKEEWDLKNKKYNDYLIDYQEYLIEKEKYETYLLEYNQYVKDKEVYETYLNELAEYNQNKETNQEAYQSYLTDKAKVDYQVNATKLIKRSMTELKRTIYDAVMGSTVTRVLEQKADLIKLEPTLEDPINYANEATLELRKLFTVLDQCETDEQYFNFYVQSYNYLKRYMEQLLKSIDKMFRTQAVNKAFSVLDKDNTKKYKEKYVILIAQLALFCNVIDDKPVYNYEAQLPKSSKVDLTKVGSAIIDFSWTVDGKTIKQVLGSVVDEFNADNNNGFPKIKVYPTPVELLVPPTEVKEPVQPTLVKEPTPPIKVANPGSAPKKVEIPIKPIEVKEPTPYVVPELTQELIDDYNNKLLVKHKELTSDYNYQAKSMMSKKIRDVDKVIIEFYDLNQNLLLKETTDKGSYIVYDGVIPKKEPNEQYIEYKFVGWQYDDGTLLDLNNVTKDGYVYPVFEGVLRTFQIKWIVNGNESIEMYEYGSIPSFKGSLEKETSNSKYYIFKSWSKEIDKVYSDETYVAIFDEFYLVETKDGYANISNNDSVLTINGIQDEMSVNIKTLTEHMNLEKYDLLVESDISKFTIHKLNVKELIKKEIDIIKLNINTNENNYEYSIEFIQNGEAINLDFEVDIIIKGNFDVVHSQLYCKKNNALEKVRSKIDNDNIAFSMNTAISYYVYLVYSISVYTSDFLTIGTNKKEAIVGEEVNIELGTLKLGTRLDRLYVMDADSNYYDVINNSFKMPNRDVFVGVNCSYINYTIRFIVDGKVIYQNTFKYGEIVTPPSDPIKVNDEEYSYTFNGWNTEITKVYENKDYTATFQKNIIKQEIIKERISIIKVLEIILISVCATVVVAVGLFIVIKKQSKKNVNNKI